ncbi:MAG: hypothetical protein GTO24_14135 [candidate division Zixibacteria bacterium]|nr:hypothetical protein [candidate division Zixibacteria bacterium]
MRIKEVFRLSSTPIPKPLVAALAVILGILVYGLILLHRDQQAFLIWIREDGLVEWLTFVELLIMSVFSFITSYAFSLSEPGSGAKKVWILIGFLLLFGAMEEISWGQRVLSIESPKWFLEHNAQGETNIHNLVIGGAKINKLVFGKILAILVGFYLVVVPLWYRVSERFKEFIDRWGIPIPQNYQIMLFIIVIILIQPHLRLAEKAGELRELSSCFFFLLILVHPYNYEVFPLQGLAMLGRKVSPRVGKVRKS